ncbi:MAG: hypothetical protein CMG17_01285 [Candidatus Marinimicrobia bacterium]|nr:hypothetical protein [Candidatus Neomarinimicrobiota bacterium]
MQADYRSLKMGAIASASQSSGTARNYNWSVAKYQENLSLLSARHEGGGLCYMIMENYTTAQEKKLYPTAFDKSSDGSTTVERDAPTAYAKFEQYVSSGQGAPSATGQKAHLATSFQDLDSKLLSLEKFEKSLIKEIQRPGVNHMGARKTALDLRFPDGFLWGKDNAYRDAAIYYRSYPKETRLQALKDMRESVLINYIEPTVMAEIVRSNRAVRSAYQMSEYEGSLNSFSSNEEVNLLPNNAYATFKVTFVDQKGNKVENLPYVASVKGAINYREAYDRTNRGKEPGNFPSGATLFETNMEAKNGKHELLRYKINDEVPHRGTFRVQVIVPDLDAQSPWAATRLKAYGGTPQGPNDRSGSIMSAKAGMILTNQVFSFTGQGTSHEVRVPVYMEPIPMHLILTDKGHLVSKWSTISETSKLPNHQKVKLRLKISRLKQTTLWEQADRNADGVITQDEYQSTAGEAARAALDFDDKIPVRLIDLEFRPSNNNVWMSARDTVTAATDLSGTATVTLSPGEYTAYIISQTDTGDRSENKIGTFVVPAGVFYRDTTENDTTPIGAAGAKMIEATSTIVDYNLRNPIPRLPTGKKAETDTIYAIKSLTAIDKGWPNAAGTQSNDEAFDYFEVLLPPLPAEVEIGEAMEDIVVEEPEEPSIKFNETIEITQESTGSVVLGIEPTPAGTKWKVSRIAVERGTTPTVQYLMDYDLNQPLDAGGRHKYAIAEIGYKRASNLASAEDILVFYPVGTEDIIAYPTESVSVQTPPEQFTWSIETVEQEAPTTQNTTNQQTVSNALPAPILSEPISITTPATPNVPQAEEYIEPIVINAIEEAENTGDMITANYLSSQAIVDAYWAGNLTYSQASQQLQGRHGWSSLDVSDALNSQPPANTQTALEVVTANNNNATPSVNLAVSNPVYPVAQNTPNAVTIDMQTTQGIINSYNAGEMTYAEAYGALSARGWSNLDITETLNTTSAVSTTSNNASDGLPSSIANQNNTPNAVTIDMQSTQAIANAYAAGNITYGQAASQLQSNHGWSSTDVSNTLNSLTSAHNAAIASAQAAANEAARFQRISNAQSAASTPAVPDFIAEIQARAAAMAAQSAASTPAPTSTPTYTPPTPSGPPSNAHMNYVRTAIAEGRRFSL